MNQLELLLQKCHHFQNSKEYYTYQHQSYGSIWVVIAETLLGKGDTAGEFYRMIPPIDPCIPKDWKEFSARYKYGRSIYNITIKNPTGKNTGVQKMIVNGKEIPEKALRLTDDGNINDIEIQI